MVRSAESNSGGMAPLRNVAALLAALRRVMERPSHLPGMMTFHGPSGYGKSWSAAAAANATKAYYVELRSSWTRKYFAQAICQEMGLPKEGSLPTLLTRAAEHLATTGRPLIVDEADFLVDRGMIEVVRELFEGSQSTIVLIGEELLPNKLQRYERVHNRMLDWVAAQPADAGDAAKLARLWCPRVELAPDLLGAVAQSAGGSVRRICVSLDRIQREAEGEGREAADLAWWGGRGFFTGQPPARRV